MGELDHLGREQSASKPRPSRRTVARPGVVGQRSAPEGVPASARSARRGVSEGSPPPETPPACAPSAMPRACWPGGQWPRCPSTPGPSAPLPPHSGPPPWPQRLPPERPWTSGEPLPSPRVSAWVATRAWCSASSAALVFCSATWATSATTCMVSAISDTTIAAWAACCHASGVSTAFALVTAVSVIAAQLRTSPSTGWLFGRSGASTCVRGGIPRATLVALVPFSFSSLWRTAAASGPVIRVVLVAVGVPRSVRHRFRGTACVGSFRREVFGVGGRGGCGRKRRRRRGRGVDRLGSDGDGDGLDPHLLASPGQVPGSV